MGALAHTKTHIRPQHTHTHIHKKSMPLINTCLNEPIIILSGLAFAAVYQQHNHPAQPQPSNNIMRPFINRSAIQALTQCDIKPSAQLDRRLHQQAGLQNR